MSIGGTEKLESDIEDGARRNVPWRHLQARAIDPETNTIFLASEEGEYHLGGCWVGSPLGGADSGTIEKIRSAMSIPLPHNSFVQLGLFSLPDIDWALNGYLESKETNPYELFREYAARRADFVKSGIEKPLVRRSGVLMNSQLMIVTIKVPVQGSPESQELQEFSELSDKFGEGMLAAGLRLERLGVDGYLRLMRQINNVFEKANGEYDEFAPLREQVYAPGDSVSVMADKLRFHDKYSAKFLSVKNYPKRASLAIMNGVIGDPQGLSNQITDPFLLMLTLRYPDQVKKASQVKAKAAIINHQVFGPTSHLIPILQYKKQGFDTLIHEMEGKGAMLCEMNLTLAVFSKDERKLSKIVSGLQTYYSAMSLEVREDKRILWPLWNSMLPLNTTENGIRGLYRFRTMAISHAVQFCPIIGEWGGTGISGSSIFVTPRGQPAIFDLYHSSTNYNAILFAESGAGKSFATQGLLMDLMAEGARAWAIDVGRSYKKLCASVPSGQFIEFPEESGLCLNPFTHIEDIDEEMDLLKAMISKMAAPNDGLDDFRLAVIEEAVKGVWSRYGNNSDINAIAEWCTGQSDNRIQDIGRQLFPFTSHGSFGRWFNGENNLQFNAQFVVLELEELKNKPHLQQVVLLQLIAKINREMYLAKRKDGGKRTKKVLIIDEAWSLLDDPVMAKAMESGFRRARKEEGAFVVVTQSLADFFQSPNGRAMFTNAAHQIIMQQKSESVDMAIREGFLKIDGYGAWRLRSIHTVPGEYSEMMIRRDGEYGVVRYVTDRFTQVLFSTKGAERDDILRAIERGESVVSAIDQFIADESSSRTVH